MTAFEADCADGKGEPMACHNCGEFFSVVGNDHDRSKKIFEINCNDRNFGPSCFNLAKLYMSGKKGGVTQDDSKAEALFSKACKLRHNPACYHEGVMLYTRKKKEFQRNSSDSVKTDLNRSLALLSQSCLGGIADACSLAAGYFLSNVEKQRDPKKAFTLLKQGCDQHSHAMCCLNLAVMYNKGDGIEKDEDQFTFYKNKTKDLQKLHGGKLKMQQKG
jgi:cytochrome c oxidase assembly factor 7